MPESDLVSPQLCADCGHVHRPWITCYGAAKTRYEQQTGRKFWTGEPMEPTPDHVVEQA